MSQPASDDPPSALDMVLRQGIKHTAIGEEYGDQADAELEALRAEVAKLRAIIAAHHVCAWCDDVYELGDYPPMCLMCDPHDTPQDERAKKRADWAEMRATIEAIIEEEPQR